MAPEVHKERMIGYIALGVAALLSLIFWAWLGSDGKFARQAANEAKRYEANQRESQIPFAELLAQQRDANDRLDVLVEALKTETELKRLHPFIVPEDYREGAGFYLKRTYDLVRENLLQASINRRTPDYEQNLGFDLEGATLPDEQAREQLVFLQLTARAMQLALGAEDGFESISVRHGSAVVTGPKGRPPLLFEYPITLELTGSLKDILQLLHQLGSDQVTDKGWKSWVEFLVDIQRQNGTPKPIQPTDAEHFPLIVYGLTINSQNTSPVGDINQLNVSISLAGMEFIPEAQRGRLKHSGSRWLFVDWSIIW